MKLSNIRKCFMKIGVMSALYLIFAVVILGDTVYGATEVVSGGYKNNKDAKWVLDDEGTLTISGTGMIYAIPIDKDALEEIYKPSLIPPSDIDDIVFDFDPWDDDDDDDVTTADLPEKIQKINPKLVKKIVICDGITGIDDDAFWSYTNVLSIDIPKSVVNFNGQILDYNMSNDVIINVDDTNCNFIHKIDNKFDDIFCGKTVKFTNNQHNFDDGVLNGTIGGDLDNCAEYVLTCKECQSKIKMAITFETINECDLSDELCINHINADELLICDLTVPAIIGGYKVSSLIDVYDRFENIIISDGIKKVNIGFLYFSNKLKTISFPESVFSICLETRIDIIVNATIYCYKNSSVHYFAENYGLPYTIIGDNTLVDNNQVGVPFNNSLEFGPKDIEYLSKKLDMPENEVFRVVELIRKNLKENEYTILPNTQFISGTDLMTIGCHYLLKVRTIDYLMEEIDFECVPSDLFNDYSDKKVRIVVKETDEVHKNMKEKLLNELKIAFSKMPVGMTDLEKVVWANSYICEIADYDYDNYIADTLVDDDFLAYGIIVNKTGVCEGYARAFNLFMDLLDVPCCVAGGLAGGGAHAWNQVYINNNWYWVDVTWNDDIGIAYYSYMLLTDDELRQKYHDWGEQEVSGRGVLDIWYADYRGRVKACTDNTYVDYFKFLTNYSNQKEERYYRNFAIINHKLYLKGPAFNMWGDSDSLWCIDLIQSNSVFNTNIPSSYIFYKNKMLYIQKNDNGYEIWARELTNPECKKKVKELSIDKDSEMPSALKISDDGRLNVVLYDNVIQTISLDALNIDYSNIMNSGNGEGNIKTGATGWVNENGIAYWYEDGEKQGLTGRGKEIYDPESNAWYWLDSVLDGAVAKSKDVYQESFAGFWGDIENTDGSRNGKWVRYDENGRMIKGWQETENGKYYFDLTYGTMAKGYATVDGTEYYFNPATGVLERTVATGLLGFNGWKEVNGSQFWYEDGNRCGVSANSSYRGKEIYDPGSDAWYWLDNIDGGKKAVSKDVYQESKANDAGAIGKWVRYDENGHMIKGWQETSEGKYYFNPTYGTMYKGIYIFDGMEYCFDKTTGLLQWSFECIEY